MIGPAVFLLCAQFGLRAYVPGLTRQTLFSWPYVATFVGMLAAMLCRRAMYIAPAGYRTAG